MAVFFFFKQKTAYEMRISDWSSDVCSSDLQCRADAKRPFGVLHGGPQAVDHRAEGDATIGMALRIEKDLDMQHILLGGAAQIGRGEIVIVAQIGRASGRESVGQYV